MINKNTTILLISIDESRLSPNVEADRSAYALRKCGYNTDIVHFLYFCPPLCFREFAANGIPVFPLRFVVVSEFKPGALDNFHILNRLLLF